MNEQDAVEKSSFKIFAQRGSILHRIPRTENLDSEVGKRHIWHTWVGLQGGVLWPVGLTPLPVTGSQ